MHRKHKMFLFFKAVFLTKHKQLQQQGRNIDLISKISNWIDENVEGLYSQFMASNPTYQQLLFFHQWYNPDTNLK